MNVLATIVGAAVALATAAAAQEFGGRQFPAGLIALEPLPGDYTGDGVLDVAVVSDRELEMLIGNGSGGWDLAPNSPYTGLFGFIARGGRSGYINSDNFLDVMVVGTDSALNGRYVVMLGLGDGTFFTYTWDFWGCDVSTFELADLDHDGDLDAVFPNDCPPGFVAFFNNGAGTFFPGPQHPTSGGTALALADFDGDGELDVAVGSSTPASAVTIALGSAGSFASGTVYGLNKAVTDLAAGDLDADGDTDLVALIGVTPNGNPRLATLLNDGTGAFSVSHGLFVDADYIALGDFDSDGRPDLAAASRERLIVARNLGGGGFEIAHRYGAGYIRAAMTIHDLDLDGHLDVLAGSDWDMTWLRGLGACAFDGGELGADLPYAGQAAAADLDGDGVDEIVLVTQVQARVMRNVGFGGFEIAATVPLPFTQAYGGQFTELGDVDGDGELDAVFANYFSTIAWTRGDGLGGLGPAQVIDTSTGMPSPNSATSIAVGDVDADGFEDVVATPWNFQPFFVLMRSLGNGAFAPPQSFPVSPSAREISLGDLDGDGREDVILRTNSGELQVFLAQAGGGFAAPSHYFLPGQPGPVTVGRIDSDPYLDVVVAIQPPQGGIATLLGDGNGLLASPIVSVGSALTLTLADVDRDGSVDVASYDSESFGWLRGDGSGAFTAREQYATEYFGLYEAGVIVADVDADGANDVVVSSPSFSVNLQCHDGAKLGGYCTPKTNSLGCVPRITSSGTASAIATSGFIVRAAPVINDRVGLCFYGFEGTHDAPFYGGTLCVRPPLQRCVVVDSGGNAPPAHDCSGAWSIDLDAFAAGALGGNPHPELQVPGTHVFCQWWGRDGGFPAATNAQLSDALHYVVLP